jgi:putative ABC transport system permease protein
MKTQTQPSPPKLARKFLFFFLRDDLVEEVCGDLEEKFCSTAKNRSLVRAKLNYWYQVLNYVRPFAIRKSKSNYLNQYAMFQNYFKIGWRNLLKQKMYSSIKIGGFAIGIAACVLIALFIGQELSYDNHYPDGDRIFRMFRVGSYRGEIGKGVYFPSPFANALLEDFPEVEKTGRYTDIQSFGAGANEIRRADRLESTHEEGFVFMDPSLLEIFHLPFLYGSPTHALSDPKTMVITKRIADKYFPNEDPIGKVFVLNNDESIQYKVTGVIRDLPVTSHLQYNFIMTLSDKEFYPSEQTNWQNGNYPTYVLLRAGTDVAEFERKLLSVTEKYFLPSAVETGGGADEIAWLKSIQFRLQPVNEIYINHEDIRDGLSHGDPRYIRLFGAIAFFILIIAGANFINLSTARSANRAREVGLRKVVGSQRFSLVKQFLCESLLFSFVSFALGLLLAWMLLPYFSILVAKSIVFPWQAWWLLPVLVVGAVVVGIIAGLYPAIYLSSFKPIHVLKGNVSRGSKTSSTRSMLVVFQFTVSIVLIVGTFVIDRQMEYVLNKKLGYDKDQVLLLQGTHTLGDNIVKLKDELVRLPEVQRVAISGYLPVEGTDRNGNAFFNEGKKEVDAPIGGQRWVVDHDYIKTMGLRIVQGRDFSIDIRSDSLALVINQAMVEALHLENPIGARITNGFFTWPVIGVVQDFHFESMKKHIQPLCMMLGRSPNAISVKSNTHDIPALIQAVNKVWKEFSPHQPIRYTFLDQRYARMYDDVERMSLIFTSFALLAIIVACLGLFALSAFMVEQRSKEVSIRLVLGASIKHIFGLLTLNFVKLVLVSLVVAIPISAFIMQEWLKEFAYKIEIGWEVFALVGVLAIVIALSTISYQSLKAALRNPVDSLRSE